MFHKILFSCGLMIAPFFSNLYAEEVLIFTEEWPPYNYTEKGKITGVSTDVVRTLLERLDKEYKIELLPSMRSSDMITSRAHSMMFSMFKTPEREPNYKWIGPLTDGSIYFYKKKGSNIKIENFDDMKNSHLWICSRHAGLVHRLLQKQGFKNLDDSSTNGRQIYRKLLAGRCDLAISESDLGVRHILKSFGLNIEEVFEKIPFPIIKADLYLVASKDFSDAEIQQWQSALDAIKSNGIYEKIIDKYN